MPTLHLMYSMHEWLNETITIIDYDSLDDQVSESVWGTQKGEPYLIFQT